MAQKRLNDFIYVHYNLRLRERQMRRKQNDSISLDNVLQENLLYDWIIEPEKQALQEDEVNILSSQQTPISSKIWFLLKIL